MDKDGACRNDPRELRDGIMALITLADHLDRPLCAIYLVAALECVQRELRQSSKGEPE